ncbi:N-6 DNA methylase [Bacillus cereus BDRD-ST24]|nr:N-6 DNA methylase [Bacillus cereus BDRD-ST24]
MRPAGTPVQRVEYIIELLLLRIFEVKLKRDPDFKELRNLFVEKNETKLFYYLNTIDSRTITEELNKNFFPFYGNILNEARKVFQGNLSIKVQDQLVLIQEVFRNSNFTNNVQSGNLEEIIQAVSDLDEERLLNTDLLGDAIESALSETGGTKDIGLFRTPDHIRHFMLGLVEPTINDTIFDPACGTGGFLFDGFEFVMESILKEEKWPGTKAHPELQEWFKGYFNKTTVKFPSDEEALNFYRSGIYGIEYLGVIRKMAAVNFYIRGLNPHNIQQGDSLAMFDQSSIKSKSVVLANPPFGAERDQEAYPNVWEDYSKESETTTLFVKLMLDSLKDGGKCAVVVSEGFLTWEQGSAKALRKLILEEAKLIGVIGLPQGVFVSKTGIGPKTSILFFEKGKPTENVWFYQVTNDGYTKGTNRTVTKGSQLIEALDIYHNYIKKGLTPKESPNSFVVPVDRINTLDPRIKEKIRQEITLTMQEKKDKEKTKLIKDIDAKLKVSKVDSNEYDQKIRQFNNVWKSKIKNEIAKKIDKTHVYSFNSATYSTNFSAEQLRVWNKVTHKSSSNIENVETLDEKYERLINSEHKDSFQSLSKFDLTNALEADIVREYVENIPSSVFDEYPELKKVDEIFKMGANYPIVRLGKYIIENTKKVKPADDKERKWVTLGVSNKDGIVINEDLKPEQTKQKYFLVNKNDFCYNPYRINVGSIGLNKFDYENQIISGAYVVFRTKEDELNPEYLEKLLKHDSFRAYVNSIANIGKGVRMNLTFDEIGNFELPLPPMEIQEEIVREYKKISEVLYGSKAILDNWDVDSTLFTEGNFPLHNIGDLTINSLYGSSEKSDYEIDGYDIIRIGNIGYCSFKLNDLKRVPLPLKKFKNYELKKGDLLIVRSNGNPKLVGKCAIWQDEIPNAVYASYLVRFRFNEEAVVPEYIMYYLMSSVGKSYIKPKAGGGTYNFNAERIKEIPIPLPDKQTQLSIIERVKSEQETVSRVEKLMIKSEERIKSLLKKYLDI